MTMSGQFLSAQVILECHGDDLKVWQIYKFERHRISIVIDTITLLILLVKVF